MSKTIPETRCQKCQGTGRAPLTQILADTLAALPKEGASAHGLCLRLRLSRGFEIKDTAMNFRLESLRSMGFVTRKRDGREWRYSPNVPLQLPPT